MTLAAGKRDRRLIIERPVPDNSLNGAGSGTWVLVGRVWANVQDVAERRPNETLSGGAVTFKRPARVQMRANSEIDATMRFVLGTRIMQIVSGPLDLGGGDIEFGVEDYSPAGNAN